MVPPPKPRTRPNRTQAIVAGVAIVALLAAVVTVVLVARHSTTSTTTGASHSPGPASNGGITSEDQLMQAITTQGWTPLRAEQLFALDVGPLPGVSVQGITPAGGFDASMAVTGLYGQWDHLTAVQRTAATAYLTPSHTQSHVIFGPADHSAGAVLLGNTTYNYQALADAANHDEALYTHTSTVEITVEPTDQQPKNPDTYAETWLWVRNGTHSHVSRTCRDSWAADRWARRLSPPSRCAYTRPRRGWRHPRAPDSCRSCYRGARLALWSARAEDDV